MINENQSLVLKFQELDINQATLIEKYSKQIRDMEEKQEQKVSGNLFLSSLLKRQTKNNKKYIHRQKYYCCGTGVEKFFLAFKLDQDKLG